VQTKGRVSVHVISDVEKLVRIRHQWNSLVNELSGNPFLLIEFSKEFIDCTLNGWMPLIIVISDDEKILGIAPLKTKKSFLGRYVDFLHPSWCSEFILDEQSRDMCIEYIIDYVFNTMKCDFAGFTLPGDSPNILPLKKQCESRRIHRKDLPEVGRRIIPITSTWTEFEESLKKNFRKELGRVKRNLSKSGSWSVTCLEGKEYSTITEKIFNVEKKSWKEAWRTHHQNGEMDSVLASVLRAAQAIKDDPDFKWSVRFLEVEDKTLSYALIIEYKEVAYVVKTSFDKDYRKYYPGLIVQNSTIQELFIGRQNKYIDFLSDLSYMQNWTAKCLPRTRIQLTKGVVSTAIQFIFEKTFVKNLVRQRTRSSVMNTQTNQTNIVTSA